MTDRNDTVARNAGVFRIDRPTGHTLPLIFDSPHSGTVFPDDFRPAVSRDQILQCTDLYVDRLFAAAPAHGAVLLSAEFPRVYIDPNRAEDDLAPADIDGWTGPATPSEKTKLGKGLIWQRIKPGATPLYDAPLTAEAVHRRLDTCYRPYHAALAALIDGAHGKLGRVWHVNCHSMQPLSGMMDIEGPALARPDIVLSDRDGVTAGREFLHAARDMLRAQGLEVAINHPFKGAEIVRRHGRPKAGRHSLQIEINRRLYLNLQTFEPNAHFAETKAVMDRLVATLAAFVADCLDS